jgi:hypothetical protein
VSALRFELCNTQLEHCFVIGGGAPDYNIWAYNGGSLLVKNFSQDSESPDGGPTKAMIYASGNVDANANGLGFDLQISSIVGGRQKTGSVLVQLEDGKAEDGGLNRPCRFFMQSSGSEDNFCNTIVRNNGKRWRGKVLADITPQRPTWIQNLDPSGQGNVISEHDYFTGPPRDGVWGRNAHILKVPTPAVSQFTEWRCAATGAYGTASPPSWFGLTPVDDGLSLAAYLQDNTYWAASAMPSGGMGFWANGPMCLFLNAIFGGSMPATPAGLYVGAVFRFATRIPTFVLEMSGAGYGRVAVGAWTLAGAGATNAAPFAFPTATANWIVSGYYDTINALVFFDALVGGNYIGAMDIPPTKILSGQTLSYAAGALTVGRATSPLGSFADSIHAKMNGFWLNHAPFTVPTIYLALSTAPASLSAPVEPVGGSYARVATTPASWQLNAAAANGMAGAISTTGVITNALPLTFAAPTADWGTGPIRSVYFMDALTAGNVLGSLNLAIPRTILSGSPARSFAVGSLWLSRS